MPTHFHGHTYPTWHIRIHALTIEVLPVLKILITKLILAYYGPKSHFIDPERIQENY